MTLPTITAPEGAPVFLAEGHEIEEDSVFAQVAYTTGHSRARRVWTVPERVVTVSWLLEPDVLAAVDDWYETTLRVGSRQFAARVRNQGASAALLWWTARWITYQVEMMNLGRGRVSGTLLLTGDGSEIGPDTGALAMEIEIPLIDIRSNANVPQVLAMEISIALVQPHVLEMEVEIDLLSSYAVTHHASGSLVAATAVLAGAAAHGTLHTSSGALAAAAAVVSGSANRATDPAFANVSLLVHFNNAGGNPIDSSSNGYTTATNSITISAAQVKYGAAAASFDGSTKYATYSHTTPLDLTTGDFTLEFWVRFNTVSASQAILVKATGTGVYPWQIGLNASGHLTFAGFNTSDASAYSITGSSTLSTGVWYHVAGTRHGTTFTLWLDGASEGTATSADALRTNGTDVVDIGNVGGVAVLDGYMDDLRITKGLARYTSGFTPPTAEFPDS